MRPVVILLAPLLIAATTPPPQPNHSVEKLAPKAGQPDQNCHGRIETAGQKSSADKADRNAAAANKAMHILAVDRRIDGCEVLVLSANDTRPLPKFNDAPGKLQPAR